MPVDANQLDAEKLAAYLGDKIEGFEGPLEAEKFAGGQSNPTYLLKARSGQYVLRRQPPGQLLKSAHAVDREFRVLSALAATDVPVARAYHLCEDRSVIGSMFYVMSFEAGRIFWDPTLPEIAVGERAAYYEAILRSMAAMHDVDIEAVGLGDFGRPGNYFERQIGVWTKQYRAAETGRLEAMETLIEWLPAHCPPNDDKQVLVHGDFRIDNMIFDPDKPEVIAILDWELATLGNPLADLAYFCMCLRLPPDGHIPGLMGMDRRELGIPDEARMVRRYCELRGIPEIENWNFYLAFSFFRLAAIAQGVKKRAIDGNASSAQARKVGEMVVPLSRLGVALAEAHRTRNANDRA